MNEWSDECDDTALQTQESKFEPWRSEAGHATTVLKSSCGNRDDLTVTRHRGSATYVI